MPKFLERKLEKEYGKGNSRVYATLNKLGFMGHKSTALKHKMVKDGKGQHMTMIGR